MPFGQNGKATPVQLEQRVSFIISLLVTGAKRAQIIDAVRKIQEREARGEDVGNQAGVWPKGRAVPAATITRYLTLAYEFFRAEAKIDREREMGRSLTQLEELYRRSFEGKRYATCISAVRERNMMLGFRKIELVGAGGGPIQTQDVPMAKMTEQVRQKEIDKLAALALERMRANAGGVGAN